MPSAHAVPVPVTSGARATDSPIVDPGVAQTTGESTELTGITIWRIPLAKQARNEYPTDEISCEATL